MIRPDLIDKIVDDVINILYLPKVYEIEAWNFKPLFHKFLQESSRTPYELKVNVIGYPTAILIRKLDNERKAMDSIFKYSAPLSGPYLLIKTGSTIYIPIKTVSVVTSLLQGG